MLTGADTVLRLIRRMTLPEVVARDRSTEYARAVSPGAPKAVQIANCWHLLANRRRPASDPRRSHPRREQAFRRIPGPSGRHELAETRSVCRWERHARWQARCEEIRRRHLAGEPLLSIARAASLARGPLQGDPPEMPCAHGIDGDK